MTNLEQFMAVYSGELLKAVQTYSNEYLFPTTDVPHVVGRMQAAILRKSYNKDGRAMKGTCKRLGIPYTYTAINAFVASLPASKQ